ncbi:MAG: hypothetical protein ACRD0K_18655 [Egibacteraceae bacterium]
MSIRGVLDATAFDVFDTPNGRTTRELPRSTVARGEDVRCAAVTLAEVCRGITRTRQVEVALKRGGQRIHVVPPDERLAKLVGIMRDTGFGSDRLGDAHVVAVRRGVDVAVVLTSDPENIAALVAALPGTPILARDPASL